MNLIDPLRHSLRRLFRSPVLSLGAIITMAMGIALCVAMFAVIDGSVLRGLPFDQSDRLVHLEVQRLDGSPGNSRVSQHDFADWREQQKSFFGLAGIDPVTVNLSDDHLPQRYHGVRISPGFLDLLRVKPFMGRGFSPDDESPGAPKVLLIGHQVWRERYDADPQIVGKAVRVNGETASVIGVLPEGFQFPFNHDVWLPLELSTLGTARGTGPALGVFGRLRDGVSLQRAAAEMGSITRRLGDEYPETNDQVTAVVKPYIDAFIDTRAQALLGIMLSATILVLLIASINVANLMVVRAAQRSYELAVRSALGANRLQTIGQVLIDAALVALMGFGLGVALAQFAVDGLNRTIAGMDPPFWVVFQIDGRALGFAALITSAAALVAGLGPAWQASRTDLAQVLQDQSRSTSSFRLGWLSRKMVILQLAVSVPLLIAAGLMMRTVETINEYDLHFEPARLLTARVALNQGDHPTADSWAAFYSQLRERIAAQPGVIATGVTTQLPMDTTSAMSASYVSRGSEYASEGHIPNARLLEIDPEFLTALSVAPSAGRNLLESDRPGAKPVVLVSEALAKREWPEKSAIGQNVRIWRGRNDPDAQWSEVVGVVPNLHFGDFDNQEDAPALYFPIAQQPRSEAWIVVRTSHEPVAFTNTLRQTVRGIDQNLPIFYARSMEEVVQRAMFFPKLLGTMFAIFGVVAAILAAIGLYGVISFRVAQRTQEMGVRLAFGGSRRHILWLILKQSLIRATVGLVVGMALAIPLSFALRGALFRLQPMDPITFGITATLFLLIAAFACLAPALRASSTDPIVALRYE